MNLEGVASRFKEIDLEKRLKSCEETSNAEPHQQGFFEDYKTIRNRLFQVVVLTASFSNKKTQKVITASAEIDAGLILRTYSSRHTHQIDSYWWAEECLKWFVRRCADVLE